MNARKSAFVDNGKARIETYIDGSGPALVVLPSYGRDGGEDYDAFAAAIARGGFSVLRPQPRGIGKSTGPMTDVSIQDQVDDVAAAIHELAGGRATILGHAYGHFVAKALPVLALGGSGAQGDNLRLSMESLASNVSGGVIEDCGHYVMEEQPEVLAHRLLEFIKHVEDPAL